MIGLVRLQETEETGDGGKLGTVTNYPAAEDVTL
jgi:hypothetical protein